MKSPLANGRRIQDEESLVQILPVSLPLGQRPFVYIDRSESESLKKFGRRTRLYLFGVFMTVIAS